MIYKKSMTQNNLIKTVMICERLEVMLFQKCATDVFKKCRTSQDLERECHNCWEMVWELEGVRMVHSLDFRQMHYHKLDETKIFRNWFV